MTRMLQACTDFHCAQVSILNTRLDEIPLPHMLWDTKGKYGEMEGTARHLIRRNHPMSPYRLSYVSWIVQFRNIQECLCSLLCGGCGSGEQRPDGVLFTYEIQLLTVHTGGVCSLNGVASAGRVFHPGNGGWNNSNRMRVPY